MPAQPEVNLSPVKGLHLTDLDLWLDPHRAKPLAFISHAHSDHVARHQQILCSPVTAHLLQRRYNIKRERMILQEYGNPQPWGKFLITLLPAGHIAGSAMIHVRDQENNASLLYTGDYKLRPSRAAETATWLPADTLIMESTFGLPKYVLPPSAEIEQQITDFVRETLDLGKTPLLLGYSLGKAQEIAAILAAHDLPFVSSDTVATMTEACREVGFSLPATQLLDSEIPPGFSLIAPPPFHSKLSPAQRTKYRSAVMTGWALDPSARFRYRTDAAIPLSDHADYPDLLRTAELVQPQKILTVHGSTRELAARLRLQGFHAWSIYGNDQLELRFDENMR